MSIEIKNYGGKVLYVAKDATDVRAAVVAATKDRADLSGANLYGAYLSGANLYGAYLSGADLSRANLYGAVLSRADLSRADLSRANLYGAVLSRAVLSGANLYGAYLSGADLSRANLSRAVLSGADLSRADLSGAVLSGAVWEQVAATLEAAIAVMNDGGRHWIKGALSKQLEDGSQAFCSVGGVNEKASDDTTRSIAIWLLSSVTAGPIENFNDFAGTTWEDVRAVFAVAILHARRFASLAPEEAPGA